MLPGCLPLPRTQEKAVYVFCLLPQPRRKLFMLSAFFFLPFTHILVLLILSLPARSQKLSMNTQARCGWAGSGRSSR